MGAISLKYKSKSGNLTAPGDVDPGAMIPLATTTLGSNAATISFSSIPQNYTHLQVRLLTKESSTGTGGPNVLASFNSDSTYTNYRSHYLYGDGTSPGAGSVQTTGYYGLTGNTVTSNASYGSMFGTMIVDILDYTDTNKYTTVRSLWGHDRNGTGETGLDSFLWINTAAVTSISFNIAGGTNFVTGSTAALYGIKRAGA